MWWALFMAAALVVLGVAFILIFRKPMVHLLTRIRSIGRTGINVESSQRGQPGEADPRAEADGLIRDLDSALIREVEETIQNQLVERNVAGDEAARVLRRYLAVAYIAHSFEYTYRLIWGSQLSLLNYLNSQLEGQPAEAIRPFYVLAASQYPTWYENYPFEQWLGFLRDSALIREDGGRLRITVRGREFLAHLIRAGYALDKAG